MEKNAISIDQTLFNQTLQTIQNYPQIAPNQSINFNFETKTNTVNKTATTKVYK